MGRYRRASMRQQFEAFREDLEVALDLEDMLNKSLNMPLNVSFKEFVLSNYSKEYLMRTYPALMKRLNNT